MPASGVEPHDATTSNGVAFGRQEVGLHLREPAKSSKASTRRDDAMVGKSRLIGPPHDLTDCARRPRSARHPSYIAVRDDTALRNSPQHMQHLASENSRRRPGRHNERYSKIRV
jgi:hypothetical protein